MAWLRWLVAASDRYTSSSTESFRPAKASWMDRIRAHFSSPVFPSTRLVVAMAPGFTKGFISFPRICSMATMELNTCPVASTPIFSSTASAPAVSITLARVNTLEIDWMENWLPTSPFWKTLPSTVTSATPKSLGSTLASAGM